MQSRYNTLVAYIPYLLIRTAFLSSPHPLPLPPSSHPPIPSPYPPLPQKSFYPSRRQVDTLNKALISRRMKQSEVSSHAE